jgi:hypothetical protein
MDCTIRCRYLNGLGNINKHTEISDQKKIKVLKSMKSISANIGPLEARRVFERKYCGALPKSSFGGLLLSENIEVI